jgi:hypothetical protein
MKIKLKSYSQKFKNLLKYILNIKNIENEIRKKHIYVDEKDVDEVKNISKYIFKNFTFEQRINIINNKLPELIVTQTFDSDHGILTLKGVITNSNNLPITECGFNVYYVKNNITYTTNIPSTKILSSLNSDNTFTTVINDIINTSSDIIGGPTLFVFNYQAFAKNKNGIAYTNFYAYNYFIQCIVENTYVTLYDRSQKYIQDISYDDLLLVWNFDKGEYDFSKPLWIKTEQNTSEYYSACFDNGIEFNFVNKHRIFNIEKGKFTNLFKSKNMRTITQDNAEINLLNITQVKKNVKYYNIITNYHMNFYANGILTSCRYNNLYPIKNMKFEKFDRMANNDNLDLIPHKFKYGMRLEEQHKNDTIGYINRLIVNESKINKLFQNKKLLFLDHSGVMTINKKTQTFDLENINYIRELTKYFDLRIIVTSDWTEFMTFESIVSLYTKYGLDTPIDYTHKKKYGSKLSENILCEELRAGEILHWVNTNNYKISDGVIFDDLDLTKYFSTDVFLWIKSGSLKNYL